jgi:hypothetical protein
MIRFRTLAFAVIALGIARGHVQAGGWSVGIRFGVPVYVGGWYPCRPYYYPYPAVIVDPAPVVVQQVPVVQAAPVAQPTYAGASRPGAPEQQVLPARPAAMPPATVAPAALEQSQLDIDRTLRLLADQNERVREDAVMSLGRARAARAIDPLAATLAGDRSPAVRDAAARALGLIGSPKALPALRRAAQVDADRDVRRSAQFAIDVVQLPVPKQ